jgi:hydrogenase maturation protein HypF
MAEHDRTDTIVALVCDGVGYGDDGTAWGGEVLVGGLSGYERAGRMRPLRLPGGDIAAKEIGRCALSWLHDLYGDDAVNHPFARRALPDDDVRHAVLGMLRDDLNCPPSTGMGRLFDAAASLLGVCDRNHYEAMSGLMLEAAADRSTHRPNGDGVLALRDVTLDDGASLIEIDHRFLLARIIDEFDHGTPIDDLAWLFHDALASAMCDAARRIAERSGVTTVGLTGGVFCNALLTSLTANRLEAAGLEALIHHTVPPNDGGIAYGQAAVAAACQSSTQGSLRADAQTERPGRSSQEVTR